MELSRLSARPETTGCRGRALSGAIPDRSESDGSPHPDRSGLDFEREVRTMFTHLARRYDGFNRVVSLGFDYLWRPQALEALDRFWRGRPVRRLLDVGCGTGDFTLLAARGFPTARVAGVDFSPAMLVEADRRRSKSAVGKRIEFGRAAP
ncbi:MAG: class I SAM-dependent methyltransferase [Thermoplasmata archaeon]